MLKETDAVIFDLDGTLVDSMWIWYDIDVAYLGRYGLTVPADLQQKIEGLGFSETARYFKERFLLPDSIEQIKAAWNEMAWEKYMRQVPLKPGVAGFLKRCKDRGIQMGIATSNSRQLVEQILAVHRLEDYFSSVITACDVGRGKPAPDIYLAVARQLQVENRRCLVFEDVVAGILSGKAAGMRVCAVEDAASLMQTPEKKRLADYYIRDFIELAQE